MTLLERLQVIYGLMLTVKSLLASLACPKRALHLAAGITMRAAQDVNALASNFKPDAEASSLQATVAAGV